MGWIAWCLILYSPSRLPHISFAYYSPADFLVYSRWIIYMHICSFALNKSTDLIGRSSIQLTIYPKSSVSWIISATFEYIWQHFYLRTSIGAMRSRKFVFSQKSTRELNNNQPWNSTQRASIYPFVCVCCVGLANIRCIFHVYNSFCDLDWQLTFRNRKYIKGRRAA